MLTSCNRKPVIRPTMLAPNRAYQSHHRLGNGSAVSRRVDLPRRPQNSLQLQRVLADCELGGSRGVCQLTLRLPHSQMCCRLMCFRVGP